MTEVLSIQKAKGQNCPSHVLLIAEATGKYIVKITWDKKDGYPEHSWGYVQWTTRPFTQTQGCDGTIDLNVHCIGIKLCQKLGLDYFNLYDEAYSWRKGDSADWLRVYDLDFVESQTKIPPLSQTALQRLLYDLNDINYRSLMSLLTDKFAELGYKVNNWWELELNSNLKGRP